MTVVVLASQIDTTADLVVSELVARDVPVFRCDAAEFPMDLTLSAFLDTAAGRWCGWLKTSHREVALEDISAVYFRRPAPFRFPAQMTPVERRFAAMEAKSGLGGVLMSLDCRWVNHPSRVADAEYKPFQLAAAVRAGLAVPASVVTNDPATTHAFAARVGGPMVYKTLASPSLPDGERVSVVYTTEVDTDRLADERIGLTAHTFQRRLAKKRDLRVTIVGEQVFCVEVGVVDGTARAELDWRADYAAHRYRVCELPAEIVMRLKTLLAGLGLRFAALDLIEVDGPTEWERFVLVDVNPNGQWGWLAETTGLSMAAAFAEELTNERQTNISGVAR